MKELFLDIFVALGPWLIQRRLNDFLFASYIRYILEQKFKVSVCFNFHPHYHHFTSVASSIFDPCYLILVASGPWGLSSLETNL